MKVLSSESPNPRTVRRISKPQMERRRRERINHSLEKLRLLMVENTQDENLKNPKAGKAEILESVVQFLKTGKEVEKGQQAGPYSGQQAGPYSGQQADPYSGQQADPYSGQQAGPYRGQQAGPSSGQQAGPYSGHQPGPSSSQRAHGSSEDTYHDGMRSCLRRVSHFIANNNQGSMATSGDAVQASQAHPEAQAHPSSSGYIHGALIPPPVGNFSALSRPHLINHPYLARCGVRPMISPAAPAASHMHVMDPVWRPWPQ